MSIQIILALALLGYFAYAQFQRGTSGPVGAMTGLSSLVGLVLVWDPGLSTSVANAIGVGRGADLIFYLFIMMAGFVSLYLHLRIEKSTQVLTELARAIALAHPRAPPLAQEAGPESLGPPWNTPERSFAASHQGTSPEPAAKTGRIRIRLERQLDVSEHS